MTISKDLFLAILAMDSYNRGYSAGIADEGENDQDGLGGLGARLGGARVIKEDNSVDAQSAGFYAVAYEWNGETIISYRGTDNPDLLGSADGASDVWRGWITGAGIPGSQSSLALDFFKGVTGSDALQGEDGSVIPTGHSLGGGLAGFVNLARFGIGSKQAVVPRLPMPLDSRHPMRASHAE